MIDRYVIPIYNIENTENFELENSIDNITYKISLKTYSRHNSDYALISEEELKEVFKYGNLDSIQNFYKIMESDDHVLHGFTKTLLVIDFMRKDDYQSYDELLYSILNSFHLSISKGISYYKYFSFKSYASNRFIIHGGTGFLNFGQTFLIHTLHSKPYNFSPMLREKHFLKKGDFSRIDKLILNLYVLYTMKENQYSRIMKLSIDYYKLSSTFEKIEQAFLILMITIEAMFKESENEKLYKKMSSLAKLISNSEVEYEEIIYKFKQKNQEQNQNEYFIGIRNSIAHGKEFLERDEMKAKVLELYEYIRRCIIEILDINDKFNLINYYEDLFKNIEIQWKNKK
jgi:ribosomal protein L35